MDSNEREELEALTQSQGWRVFADYVNSEWGPGGRAFESAAEAAANDNNPHSVAHLQQIIASRREIQRIIAWPAERLKYLKGSEPELAMARDYSRRGGL